MCFHCHLHSIRLKQLAHIGECPEIFRLTVFSQQKVVDPLIGSCSSALVGHHHFGCKFPISGMRCIAFDRFKLRERLETVFTEKATPLFVKLRQGLKPLPHFPIMHITHRMVTSPLIVRIGRRLPVTCSRMIFFDYLRKCHKILVFKLFPYKFRIGRILPVISRLPVPVEPGIQAFVISTPQSNTCMIAQATYVINRFPANILQQIAFCRKHTASKHEILPYENALLIT